MAYNGIIDSLSSAYGGFQNSEGNDDIVKQSIWEVLENGRT